MTSADTGVTPEDNATADRTALEGFLRDIYGIAAYFTAHPELPLPHYVTLSVRAGDREHLDRLAAGLDTHVYADRQCDIDLQSAPGRTVNVTVAIPGRPTAL